MFGMLTELEIEAIFRDGLTMADDVRWTPQPSSPRWTQFGVFLDSPRETTIRLTMGVNLVLPRKYKILVIRGEQVLRRLDVRGGHKNPPAASAGAWMQETHKHRWTDRFGDAEAYTPSDIDTTTFSPEEHGATFRAFCKESNIDFKGRWSDPPTPDRLELDL